MAALLGYASHLPVHRLVDGRGRSTSRVVASFDENSTTMAVEAARALLDRHPQALVDHLWLTTSTPAYLDKTNASAVHAALGLRRDVFAADVIGTGRSTVAALRAAAASGGLVVTSDVRVGRVGSADESRGGDGAAALLFGPGPGIAEVVHAVSATEELLDRWRPATSVVGEQWEERFGLERYLPLAQSTVASAMSDLGLESFDHAVVVSPNAALVKRAGSVVPATSVSSGPIGFGGADDLALGLCAVLDRAEPGETIALVLAADGCDVLVLRAGESLPTSRQARSVEQQLEHGRDVDHLTYLTWRGLVEREAPRRPEPDRPAAPPSARSADWKFGFVGGRCTRCGFMHLPPVTVCRGCGSAEGMVSVRAASLRGTVATFTVDRLAFSLSPPVVDVVVDFDGGGRSILEVADADPDELTVGTRVEMTFRSLFTAGGVHDYFWKARVLRDSKDEEHR